MAGSGTQQEGEVTRGRYACLLAGLVFCLLAPDGAWAQADATEVFPGAQGLTGVTQINPGTEVQIYSVEVQDGNPANGVIAELGLAGMNLGLRITISDLSTVTGVSAADFTQMRLYRSTDAILDGGDAFMTSTTPVVVNIASFTELDATGAGANRLLPDGPASTFFLVSVVLSSTATQGHAFRVSAATPHIGIDETGIGGVDGAIGSLIGPSDGNSIVVGFSGAKAVGGGTVAIPFGGETIILFLLLISSVYMLRRRGY